MEGQASERPSSSGRSNYIRFIVDLCEWRQGATGAPAVGDVARAEQVFGPTSPCATQNLAFLFDAFDAWVRKDTGEVEDAKGMFKRLLTTTATPSEVEQGKVVVFGDVANNIDLFQSCCNTRIFGSRRSLLLYAVLLHRIHATDDFPRRVRVVRNLIEASTNEIRLHAMPKLVADVQRIIVDDDLDSVETFNTEQLNDEVLKRDFLAQHPELEHELFHLEDHEILRGCLMAFELDAEVFEQRARLFRAVFGDPALMPALTGALLAVGAYSRELAGGKHRFGPPTQPSRWRDLLAGDAPSRTGLGGTRAALGRLLDLIAGSDLPLGEQLHEVQHDWLRGREAERRLDWRYYLVQYSAMREGASGIYAAPNGIAGFSLCMLEGTALNGYYRDPFLLAVARACDAQEAVWGGIEHKPDGPWFTGSASAPRWMRLRASGVQIRCVTQGFVVQPPADGEYSEAFENVRVKHGLVEVERGYLLEAPHEVADDSRFDTADRVQLGAALLAGLVDAGL